MTKGYYGGGTFGFPFGLGGGLYMDSHGRAYPQLYTGTPGFSFSGGYTPDLEGLLTGPSISGSPGVGPIRVNVGGNTDTVGIGIGTPGTGATHGFGPLKMSNDYSRPWTAPSVRESSMRAQVPSRHNVFEYDYPESSEAASLPNAVTNSNDGQFLDDNESSSSTTRQPLRHLGRHTYSLSRRYMEEQRPATGLAPMQPQRPLSINDAVIEYQKRNPDQALGSTLDDGMPPPPLVPVDDSKVSGGLLGRLTALMGIDPRNPERLAPPPQNDDLRAFYRDDPQQPWFVQRR